MYVVTDVTLNMKGLKHQFKYMNIDTSGYVSQISYVKFAQMFE